MLSTFISQLGAYGTADPSKFAVQFTRVPPKLIEAAPGGLSIQRDARFFCESTEMPGTQMLYNENRVYNMPSKFVFGKLHDELNLVFRLDRDYNIKRLLDLWIDSMYNPVSGNVAYKNDYSGTIEIHSLNAQGMSVYSARLEDAFPTQISPISLSWDMANEVTRLPVVFGYTSVTYNIGMGSFPLAYDRTTQDGQFMDGMFLFGKDGLGNINDVIAVPKERVTSQIYKTIQNAGNNLLSTLAISKLPLNF